MRTLSLRNVLTSLIVAGCAGFTAHSVALALGENEANFTTEAALASITEDELRTTLTYLASEELKGRDSGSEGLRMAARYLIPFYEKYGLKPMGDEGENGARGYLQAVPCGDTVSMAEEGNALSVFADIAPVNYLPGSEFTAFSLSPNAEVKDAAVAFVSYGISDEAAGWDDYTGVDVAGKIAVMFRYDAAESAAGDDYRASQYASFVWKVRNAVDHGASGVVIINGPLSKKAGEADVLYGSGFVGDVTNQKAPVIHAKRAVLAALLQGTEWTPETLQRAIDTDKAPKSFVIPGKTMSLSVNLRRDKIMADNIVGLLEGSDPALKNEIVVIGAHYDHVGLGEFGSLGGPAARGQIHNGADDNASGSSGIVEIMEAVARLRERPRRSILFMHFCGEERGLLGSQHFVNHPTVPLNNIVAMLNADMIGRSNPTGVFNIGGAGTSSVFKNMLDRYKEQLGLNFTTSDSGRAPSDNSSFFEKGIPVLFYYSGGHPQYHTPEDDVDLINFEGQAQICRHMLLCALELANADARPDFINSDARKGVKLGIQLDPSGDDLRVTTVMDETPAARAGLRQGDLILEIGSTKLASFDDLRAVLRKLKEGDTTTLTVERGTEKITLTITF